MLRATASQEGPLIHQTRAVDTLASQDAAAVNRRRMIMLGCACCSSLMLAGQHTPAKASDGSAFTYGECNCFLMCHYTTAVLQERVL